MPRKTTAPEYDPDLAAHYVRETLRLSLAALFEDLSGELDNRRYETNDGLGELESTLFTYAEVIRRTRDVLNTIDPPRAAAKRKK